MVAVMETISTPDRPTGAVRYVVKRVDLSHIGAERRHFRWFPDYQDEQMRAQLQREVAALNAWDARHPELMEELEAMAYELMASLPDYDWGGRRVRLHSEACHRVVRHRNAKTTTLQNPLLV